MTAVAPTVLAPVRQKLSADEVLMRIGVVLVGCFLLLAVVLPWMVLLIAVTGIVMFLRWRMRRADRRAARY